jgi:hypothetical protein
MREENNERKKKERKSEEMDGKGRIKVGSLALFEKTK